MEMSKSLIRRTNNDLQRNENVFDSIFSHDGPWSKIDEMFQVMENSLSKIIEDRMGVANTGQIWGASKFPRLDLYSNENGDLQIDATIPGYNKEDVSIHVDNGYITIEGNSSSNMEQLPQNNLEPVRIPGDSISCRPGDKDFIDNVCNMAIGAWSKLGQDVRSDISKEDCKIYVDPFTGDVTVSLSKDKSTNKPLYYCREIKRSSFCRSININSNIYDLDEMTAHVDNGILSINIPKKKIIEKTNQHRKVEIS